MKKICLNSINPFSKCISYNSVSRVYRIDNDNVFKMFDYGHLISLLDNDYDIEDNILKGSRLVNDSNIVVPSSCVYRGRSFIGYTMPFIDGVSIMNYVNDSMSLGEITNLYSKLESIVRKNDNIVFPDMLTDGNILIDESGEVHFIDFDGLQVSNYFTPAMSSGLGNRGIYDFTKYKNGRSFTKELDIKSLIYLYFSMVFRYPMEDLDNGCFDCSNEELLNDLFNYLGIEDNDLFNKVLRLYSDDSNQYLGNTVMDIADNYDLDVINDEHCYVKRLVRK